MRHRLKRVAATLLLLPLGACEALREHFSQPQNAAAMNQTMLQMQEHNQRNYELHQAMLMRSAERHHEQWMAMQPTTVRHTGTINVKVRR